MFRRAPTAEQVAEGFDLAGKRILVTGADSGIGFHTARALAGRGAAVWLGCLRQADGDRAVDAIRADHPDAEVHAVAFDLGDLRAVRLAASTLAEALPQLDVIVCNAGVYGGPYAETVDGFERTFGVCYLGHAALVLGLLGPLRAARGARVVLVSSQNHRWPLGLDVNALPIRREAYSELAAYGQAKRCVVLLARALTDRFGADGISANALHPGDLVSTGIDRDSALLRWVMWLARPFAPTAAQAAATSVWLAGAPELAGVGGGYYVDRRQVRPAPGALDPDVAAALWARTERWLALSERG